MLIISSIANLPKPISYFFMKSIKFKKYEHQFK